MAVESPPRSASESVRSVERTLDLLAALEHADHPMGLSDLARATGIPKATAQRLLTVLERRGFVQKERLTYQLGTAVVPLAGAFLTGNSLARAALPALEQLALASGETSSLQARQGFDRVVIQRVLSVHSLGYSLRIGQRLPLLVGASGSILAANMPPEELAQLIASAGEIHLADGTLLSRIDLLTRIETVRRQGYAVSRGEREGGVVSVASPIQRAGNPVIATIAVTGPTSRMGEEKVDQISISVRQVAAEIAQVYSRL
jgi:DNA-binding IclR family transcriptional regulator